MLLREPDADIGLTTTTAEPCAVMRLNLFKAYESKVRLGVGIGAFVLIVGLVFGVSRILIHFDKPWTYQLMVLRPACLVWTMRLTRTIF